MRSSDPATEALICAAFAEACVITAKAAARFLGMDVKTLDRLVDEDVLRAVRRGNLRAYIERDIRVASAVKAGLVLPG